MKVFLFGTFIVYFVNNSETVFSLLWYFNFTSNSYFPLEKNYLFSMEIRRPKLISESDKNVNEVKSYGALKIKESLDLKPTGDEVFLL